jgi:long-subunit fatty acid transport protein
MFGIPIERNLGITVNFGVVPVTSVHYGVSVAGTDTNFSTHTLDYSGDGGISKIFLSTSYKLPMDFSLGVGFDYYTGKIDYNSAITFNAADTLGFSSAIFTKQYSYHGLGYTAGLISPDIAKILGIGGVKNFRFGVTYSSAVPLHCDSVINLIGVTGTTVTALGSKTVNLPYKIGVGTAFLIKDSYLFSLDYLYQPYSQLTLEGVSFPNMQDYRKMSLGFEYRNPSVRTSTFWEQVALRGGLSYEQSQYIFNGTSINQVSVYAGCSLPLGSDNSLDLGFKYGRRGTTDNNLMQENIYNFSVSVSLGELWFQLGER